MRSPVRHPVARDNESSPRGRRRRPRRRGLRAVVVGTVLAASLSACIPISSVLPISCLWCSGVTVRVLFNGEPVRNTYVYVSPNDMYALTDDEGRLIVPSFDQLQGPTSITWTKPFPDDPYCADIRQAAHLVPGDTANAYDFALIDAGAVCA